LTLAREDFLKAEVASSKHTVSLAVAITQEVLGHENLFSFHVLRLGESFMDVFSAQV